MDTRDLKVFVAVYETKSITRAAKDQFLSPQGCSKIIQKIEGELGTSLFARNHFGVAPTPQGDALYRRAQMVIRLLDGVKDEVEAARALKYTLEHRLDAGRFGVPLARVRPRFRRKPSAYQPAHHGEPRRHCQAALG